MTKHHNPRCAWKACIRDTVTGPGSKSQKFGIFSVRQRSCQTTEVYQKLAAAELFFFYGVSPKEVLRKDGCG